MMKDPENNPREARIYEMVYKAPLFNPPTQNSNVTSLIKGTQKWGGSCSARDSVWCISDVFLNVNMKLIQINGGFLKGATFPLCTYEAKKPSHFCYTVHTILVNSEINKFSEFVYSKPLALNCMLKQPYINVKFLNEKLRIFKNPD